MALVPKSEGHRGGISAFILPYDSDGVTVTHRNAFMGLRGIENSVTTLENVFVPRENLIGREGQGLRAAIDGGAPIARAERPSRRCHHLGDAPVVIVLLPGGRSCPLMNRLSTTLPVSMSTSTTARASSR